MKNLNYPHPLARTPIWTDDMRFLQGGISEVFAAILEGLSLGETDFIISGCKITDNGSKVSMTAGWCYYNGEVLPVRALPATSYTGSSPKIKFTKVTNFDPAGQREVKLSETTGVSQVFRNDYLAPSLVTGSAHYQLAISKGAWDLSERIANSVKAVDSGTLSPNDLTGSGIRYRMIGGMVQLYGHIRQDAVGAGWNAVVASGLPRPALPVYLPNDSGYIEVRTNGELFVRSKNDTVYLNHIVYLASPVYDTADGHYSTIAQQYNGGAVL